MEPALSVVYGILDKQQEGLNLARKLKQIFLNDKTQYDYHGKRALNRFDMAPDKGKRWLTPSEIAESILRDMGYRSPYDVPDRQEVHNEAN